MKNYIFWIKKNDSHFMMRHVPLKQPVIMVILFCLLRMTTCIVYYFEVSDLCRKGGIRIQNNFSTRAVLGFRGFCFSRCVEQVVVWKRVIRFGLVSVSVSLTFIDWFRVCPEPWGSDRELIVMYLLDYLGKGAKSNQGFSCKWVPCSVL